jgi:hypothetical protein
MYEIPWHDLTREQKDLYVTLLWADGYTEQAIADFFDATKGRAVVHRQRVLKLPSTNRPVVKKTIDPERFRDLLDLHAMREMEAKGVAAIAPVTGTVVSRSVSATENVTAKCQWPLATGGSLKEPTLCGEPVLEGHSLCKKHHDEALGRRR